MGTIDTHESASMMREGYVGKSVSLSQTQSSPVGEREITYPLVLLPCEREREREREREIFTKYKNTFSKLLNFCLHLVNSTNKRKFKERRLMALSLSLSLFQTHS